MDDRPEHLVVAALGDLHIRGDRDTRIRDLFGEISRRAGVLVLCGDLTDTGRPEEAAHLAEDLHACSIPALGVLGNHDYECDKVEEVTKILEDAGLQLLDGHVCEIEGVGFVGAKGFAGGFGPRMLGSFGEPAVKRFVAESVNEALQLENAMRTLPSRRSLAVLHYAPVTGTLEGEPLEIFPFLGSSRLAETIDRFGPAAVVHGHAHHGVYEGRTPGGVPVYNASFSVEKPSGRPYALIEI